MKLWYMLLLLSSMLIKAYVQDPYFVVVICSYNNSAWYRNNLDSVFMQDYLNYHVIYIDDYSSDQTAELVACYIQEKKLAHQVTLIRNNSRFYKLANIYSAVHQCNDTDIIIELDGDDWLSDCHVLSYLAQVYRDSTVWLTYGSYKQWPQPGAIHCRKIHPTIIQTNAFRRYPWVTGALRTYYAGLFKKIKQEDLQENGIFFEVAADVAYMFPMLEMSASHSYFIAKILYIYNTASTINDFKQHAIRQWQVAEIIRNKESYTPLERI